MTLFRKQKQAPPTVAVYQAGTLGGLPMDAAEQSSAVEAALGRETSEQGARAIVQVLETAAANWQYHSQKEDIAHVDMGRYYAGGAAALADVLQDLKTMARV